MGSETDMIKQLASYFMRPGEKRSSYKSEKEEQEVE